VVVDQPATIGALAVAVAQDMGITVGYLPGLSMRRIADLTPSSAKTDAKDAAVIAGAARTMPHTLRAINASDEDAAALSMLTGFDLDLARQVNQSANRIRGQWLNPDPAQPSRAVVGPWPGARRRLWRPVAAWPTPADLKHAGRTRLKKHGCRRHATWASQIVSALEHQTVVVARGGRRHHRSHNGATSPGQAAHRPTRSAGRCRRPGRDPGGWPTLMCQVLTTRARDQGSRPQPSLLAQPLRQGPPGTGAQLASYAGLAPVTRRCGSSIRGEVRLPRRQQEAQARHVPLRLRLPALRPRLPVLLPTQTRPRQTALDQAVLTLAHRRILTLHAMTRDGALYDPQPSTQLPTAA